MLIIPAIDIIGGKVVRLEKGEFQKAKFYDSSPLEFAKKWQAQGADFIHIVDLDGAKSGQPKNFETIKDIVKNIGSKTEVGGGIRSLDAIKMYLDIGVERVVLSTKIVEDASFLAKPEIKSLIKNLVVSIDIKDMVSSEVITSGTGGWLEGGDTLLDIPSFVDNLLSCGIRYMNFSDISRDGTLAGPDIKKISIFLSGIMKKFAEAKLFLTYAGGVSSLDDIKRLCVLADKGLCGVILGRALYENKFSLKEAIEIASS